jgi:hypothetical protein
VTWSYWFCDTLTGEKQLEVEPAGGSWSRRLNVTQSGSHVFSLGDRLHTRATWRSLTETWNRVLVQCWDDVPVYAGVVTGRPYNRDTQMLTVQHTDIRSWFSYRYPFGVAGYSDVSLVPGNLTITSKSLVSAVGLVLDAGLKGPIGAPYAIYPLPIVLPSLVESGSFSAVYENYNFQRVADILDDLQGLDGGPDVEFVPQWSGTDTLEWVTRAGALTGGTFDFDLTAADSPVSSYKSSEDGLKQVTGVFGIGQGYGLTMAVGGTANALPYVIPARDTTYPVKMATTPGEAGDLAFARVQKYKYATVQPELTVLATEVSPTDLVLGSTITVTDSDDPFLPDGPTDFRLIGLSGGVGDSLTLTIEEEFV